MAFSAFVLIACAIISPANAQTVARGGCTSVEVTRVPNYPTVYFANAGYTNGTSGRCTGTPSNRSRSCSRVLFRGSAVGPRYTLQRRDRGGTVWRTVGGTQSGRRFSNLSPGLYRVRVETPGIDETICTIRNEGPSTTCVFSQSGRYLGVWGRWGGRESSITTSNEIVVGPTDEEDSDFRFRESSISGSSQAADEGEGIRLVVDRFAEFDQWYLAIKEEGGPSRYFSTGWQNGTGLREFDLTRAWDAEFGESFQEFRSYRVQFVTENQQCRNGIEHPAPRWNVNEEDIFICRAGSGCLRVDLPNFGALAPNPATTSFAWRDLDSRYAPDCHVRITDLAGRVVLDEPLEVNEVDISTLQRGTYFVSLSYDGQRVRTEKLAVQ